MAIKLLSFPHKLALSLSIGKTLKISLYQWVTVGGFSWIQLNNNHFIAKKRSLVNNLDFLTSKILFLGGSPKRNWTGSLQILCFNSVLISLVVNCQKLDCLGQLQKQNVCVPTVNLHLRRNGDKSGSVLFITWGFLCCLWNILYCIFCPNTPPKHHHPKLSEGLPHTV